MPLHCISVAQYQATFADGIISAQPQRNPSAARPRTSRTCKPCTQSTIGAASVQPPGRATGERQVRIRPTTSTNLHDTPNPTVRSRRVQGTSLDPCSFVGKNNSIESPNSHGIDVAITADSLFGSGRAANTTLNLDLIAIFSLVA